MFSALYRLLFNQSCSLKPLMSNWSICAPEYLWFVKKTSPFDKTITAKLTSLRDVELTLGIKWTDVIQSNKIDHADAVVALTSNHHDLPTISNNEYSQRSKELMENCAIRWLNNDIGWVVTLRPGKTLKKGYFCCYAGIIKKIYPHQYSSYQSREYLFSLFKTEKEELVVDARHTGNMARLLPFLLDKGDLDNFEIDSHIKNEIAVANLKFQFALINGIKTPAVFAPEDITAPAHQELLLGLNYSLPYLYKMQQDNKAFKLINKNTFAHIDPAFYFPKKIEIQLDNLDYSFQIPRFRIMIGKYLPHLKQKTVGFNEEKKEYYKIIISDADLYQALMKDPTSKILKIQPIIKCITQEEYNKIYNS